MLANFDQTIQVNEFEENLSQILKRTCQARGLCVRQLNTLDAYEFGKYHNIISNAK